MKNIFHRSGILSGAVAVAAGLAMLGASPEPALAKDKNVEAAIVGGIVGVAVGAALSRKHQHDNRIYYPNYRPYYAPGGYDPYFAGSFKPAPGVICYTAQRACYNANGSYANKWSRRAFGY